MSDADQAAITAMRQQFEHILKIKQQISGSQAAAGDALGLGDAPGRATGGPVTAGQSYVVGDGAGPELFVPGMSGRIFSTNDTRNLMSAVVSAIEAGEHGGRRALHSTTNMPITANVNVLGGPDLQGMLRQSAMQAKQARIRQS